MAIRDGLPGKNIENSIEKYCTDRNITEVDRLMAMMLSDLDFLHAGAIAGLGISETKLNA